MYPIIFIYKNRRSDTRRKRLRCASETKILGIVRRRRISNLDILGIKNKHS